MLELVFMMMVILIVQCGVSVLVLLRMKRLKSQLHTYLEAKMAQCEQMADALIQVLQEAKLPPGRPVPCEDQPQESIFETPFQPPISQAVHEVLELQKQGMSSPEIAQKLTRPIGEINLICRLYGSPTSTPLFHTIDSI